MSQQLIGQNGFKCYCVVVVHLPPDPLICLNMKGEPGHLRPTHDAPKARNGDEKATN